MKYWHEFRKTLIIFDKTLTISEIARAEIAPFRPILNGALTRAWPVFLFSIKILKYNRAVMAQRYRSNLSLIRSYILDSDLKIIWWWQNFVVFEILIKYRAVASFTCKHSRSGNTLEILIFARLDYEYIYKKERSLIFLQIIEN